MTQALSDAVACAAETDDVPEPEILIEVPFEYLVWADWQTSAPVFTKRQVSQLAQGGMYVCATYDLDSKDFQTQVAVMLTSERELSGFELASALYARINGVFWNGSIILPQPAVSWKALGDQVQLLIAENMNV